MAEDNSMPWVGRDLGGRFFLKTRIDKQEGDLLPSNSEEQD